MCLNSIMHFNYYLNSINTRYGHYKHNIEDALILYSQRAVCICVDISHTISNFI